MDTNKLNVFHAAREAAHSAAVEALNEKYSTFEATTIEQQRKTEVVQAAALKAVADEKSKQADAYENKIEKANKEHASQIEGIKANNLKVMTDFRNYHVDKER